jgi:hypothetical protein
VERNDAELLPYLFPEHSEVKKFFCDFHLAAIKGIWVAEKAKYLLPDEVPSSFAFDSFDIAKKFMQSIKFNSYSRPMGEQFSNLAMFH